VAGEACCTIASWPSSSPGLFQPLHTKAGKKNWQSCFVRDLLELSSNCTAMGHSQWYPIALPLP
jgi:hypothetical protein